jgi:hypothetical protein
MQPGSVTAEQSTNHESTTRETRILIGPILRKAAEVELVWLFGAVLEKRVADNS